MKRKLARNGRNSLRPSTIQSNRIQYVTTNGWLSQLETLSMWIDAQTHLRCRSTTIEIEPGRVSPALVFATDGKTQNRIGFAGHLPSVNIFISELYFARRSSMWWWAAWRGAVQVAIGSSGSLDPLQEGNIEQIKQVERRLSSSCLRHASTDSHSRRNPTMCVNLMTFYIFHNLMVTKPLYCAT